MADTTQPKTSGNQSSGGGNAGGGSEGKNTPVAKHGDHDRVQMLSLKADGTPDQLNPEFIGDKDQTLKATEEQFTQQAVSAADVEARAELDAKGRGTEVEDPKPDPEIKKLEQAHEKAAKAGKSAAKKAVDALSNDKK